MGGALQDWFSMSPRLTGNYRLGNTPRRQNPGATDGGTAQVKPGGAGGIQFDVCS
jgi:hypothetical protein